MGIKGFTYNGKHSSEYNLIITTKSISLLPTLKKREISIAGYNIPLDFGNNTYEPRMVQIDCSILAKNIPELKQKIRRIAGWLACGKQKLTFDDEHDKYYMAKIYSEIDVEKVIHCGTLSIIFECEPFAYFQYNVNDIILDTYIPLDSYIRLDDRYSYNVTGNTSFEIHNFGTYEVRPIINITGSFNTLSITINGKTLNYNETVSNNTVTIDNNKYTVKKDSENKLSVVTGDLNTFLTLPVGVNNVSVFGTGLNATITFNFNPLFL